VGLERGPLSLVSTTEELLDRKRKGSGLEIDITAVGDPPCRLRDTLYPQNLALTSPTSGGRSLGTVRSRSQATEFVISSACTARNSVMMLSNDIERTKWKL
jgi:hypothetical protein